MKSTGVCKMCKGVEGKQASHKYMQPIGEPVELRVSVGRGHDMTEHFFLQCSKCGSVWVKLVDSGAGGHGTFYRRLTEGMF
jgi:hypothetical protein